jgi:DDE family transposase
VVVLFPVLCHSTFMSATRKKTGPPTKPVLTEEDICGIKYLKNFIDLLRPLRDHCDCPNRNLHYDEYAAYLLLFFFTPILTSMRGLQQASNFDSIREKLRLPRFSLGSFSEAGSVFDPELLVPIIEQLAAQTTPLMHDKRLTNLSRLPTLVDGSYLKALPRMVWALWLDESHRSAKMHLQYSLMKGVPVAATLTDGHTSETDVLSKSLKPGLLYVTDRGYAKFELMLDIINIGSSFLVRLPKSHTFKVVEHLPIDEVAAELGVTRRMLVNLGTTHYPKMREKVIQLVELRIWSEREGKEQVFLLATDQIDMAADLVADLYRWRWQVELFFRWYKKILSADKPLSLSQNGMTIIMYCALIASQLVVLWTGRKPAKRTFEMLCFYFSGWVSDEELVQHLIKLPPADPAK